MKITVAEKAGFCFGVARAAERVEALLGEDSHPDVYTVGTLIHNRLYNEELASRGVKTVSAKEAASLIPTLKRPSVFVLRTHGVLKAEEGDIRRAAEGNPLVTVEDMTCPFVKKIHRIAAEESRENTVFLLLGSAAHPEVLGIMSYAEGEKAVVADRNELKAFLDSYNHHQKKLVLAAQTTQNTQEWNFCKKILKNQFTNAKIFGTICSVTEDRQKEAIRLAKVSDAMLVVGGSDSSNTAKLYELCRENCSNTRRIESARDLTDAFPFLGSTNIGITAGASTPRGIILEVEKQMENFAELLEESLKTLHTGETVTGIVSAITDTQIYLDLGAKVTGVIEYDQITDEPGKKLSEMFKNGDSVTAFVIRVDDGKGVATLSKKRVDADKNWLKLVALQESGEIVEGTIVDVVKGGALIVIDGMKVFIPASHASLTRNADLAPLAGTTQRVRIIEIDQQKKRAIASIRVVAKEERKAAADAAWQTLEIGQHYMGVVKNLTTYGAFVDLGGVDGMIHNSELSWKRIKHPSQVVSVGQELEVYIKELDVEKKRISLGYKTQEMDTFYQFTKDHNVGDVIEAKIVSMMQFGAFAEVAPGVDGLIHISKIALEKIEKPEDVLSIGQVVTVKITDIDAENRKLSLSIRALLEEERRAAEKAERDAQRAQREAQRKAEADEQAKLDAEMAPYIVRTID